MSGTVVTQEEAHLGLTGAVGEGCDLLPLCLAVLLPLGWDLVTW